MSTSFFIMLEYLHIKNFQSLKKVRFDFVSGVNTIIGLPSAGKTPLIRALRLLCYNRPLGASYYSNFAPASGETTIDAGFTEGVEVSLVKKITSKAEKKVRSTGYYVNGEFAYSNITPEIKNLIGLSSINFQYQEDIPYLVSFKPSQVASTINKLTRLDIADKVIKSISSMLNTSNREIKKIALELEGIDEKISAYDVIDTLSEQMEEANKISENMQRMKNRASRLRKLIVSIKRMETRIVSVRKFEKRVRTKLNKASRAEAAISEHSLRHEQLMSIIEEIRANKKALSVKRRKLKGFENEYIKQIKKQGCPICKTSVSNWAEKRIRGVI